jgi:DNA-binding NarL/FixJ family response regulator
MSPVQLSPRQQQVAQLINQGFTYEQIAAQLEISSRTVEGHAAKLRAKLGERSARRAASRARGRAPSADAQPTR